MAEFRKNVSKGKILVLVPAQILVLAWFGVNVLVVCLAHRLQACGTCLQHKGGGRREEREMGGEKKIERKRKGYEWVEKATLLLLSQIKASEMLVAPRILEYFLKSLKF